MNLKIETLNIEFPASLGGRKHSILRLLRSELIRMDWPQGQLEKVSLPAITISSQQTNLSIARALALSLQKATQHTSNKRGTSPSPAIILPSLARNHLVNDSYQGGAL